MNEDILLAKTSNKILLKVENEKLIQEINDLKERQRRVAVDSEKWATMAREKQAENEILEEEKISNNPLYGRVEIVDLDSSLADPETVDAVLTFRNLHNWLGPQMDGIFSNTYKALKPGGVFGVVEHTAKQGTSMDIMKKSGYVTEQLAIEIAKKHGFELVAKSEVNSNPKDTADHPRGVWTLPPNLALKEVDRDKYLEIGESDRMTLLFRKPAKS